MPEQPLNEPTEENKPPERSNIEVGSINVGRDVHGNLIVGNNNIINLSPKEQVIRSLHQLPQPPADFTGREELITQLLADFEKGKGAAITGQPIQLTDNRISAWRGSLTPSHYYDHKVSKTWFMLPLPG